MRAHFCYGDGYCAVVALGAAICFANRISYGVDTVAHALQQSFMQILHSCCCFHALRLLRFTLTTRARIRAPYFYAVGLGCGGGECCFLICYAAVLQQRRAPKCAHAIRRWILGCGDGGRCYLMCNAAVLLCNAGYAVILYWTPCHGCFHWPWGFGVCGRCYRYVWAAKLLLPCNAVLCYTAMQQHFSDLGLCVVLLRPRRIMTQCEWALPINFSCLAVVRCVA